MCDLFWLICSDTEFFSKNNRKITINKEYIRFILTHFETTKVTFSFICINQPIATQKKQEALEGVAERKEERMSDIFFLGFFRLSAITRTKILSLFVVRSLSTICFIFFFIPTEQGEIIT